MYFQNTCRIQHNKFVDQEVLGLIVPTFFLNVFNFVSLIVLLVYIFLLVKYHTLIFLELSFLTHLWFHQGFSVKGLWHTGMVWLSRIEKCQSWLVPALPHSVTFFYAKSWDCTKGTCCLIVSTKLWLVTYLLTVTYIQSTRIAALTFYIVIFLDCLQDNWSMDNSFSP